MSAASVIARDPNPFLQYVIINRGSDDGLRRGMPVVTQQGLVGRIAAVTAAAARVQLITDPGSSINVRLEPSQAQAVLQGQITGDVNLVMIPQSANIQAGDLVLTASGSSARQTNITKDTPVDAVIMSIIDSLEVEGEITFRKS